MPEHQQPGPSEFVKLPPLNIEQGEWEPSSPGLRIEWRDPKTNEVVAPRFDCNMEEIRGIADVMDISPVDIENTCVEFVDAETLDGFSAAHYDAQGKTVVDAEGKETRYDHVVRIAGRAAEGAEPADAEMFYNTTIVHELEHMKQHVEGRMEKGSVSERRAAQMGRAAAMGTLTSPAIAAVAIPKMLAENFAFHMLDRVTELPVNQLGTLLAIGAASVGAIFGHRKVGEMAYRRMRGVFHKIDKFENEAREAETKYGSFCRAVTIPN